MKPTWIYCVAEIGSEESGPCKIGISCQVSTRVSSLQAGNWRPIKLLWKREAQNRDHAKLIESQVLSRYRPSIYTKTDEDRLKSEWVGIPPSVAMAWADNILAQLAGPE